MSAVRTDRQDVHRPPLPAREGGPRTLGGRGLVSPVRLTAGHPAELPSRSLDEVLERRRSERFFTDEPVGLEVLTEALRSALAADDDLWPSALEWATRPQLVVAALRVVGLSPGLYRFEAPTSTYVLLAEVDRDAVAQMVLQVEYADAPVIVAAVGSPADAVHSRGDHGLRLLHLRAGSVCYSTLLAASFRGLTGSVFAGFLPSGLRHHVVADGYHLSQVFAVALGRASAYPETPPV